MSKFKFSMNINIEGKKKEEHKKTIKNIKQIQIKIFYFQEEDGIRDLVVTGVQPYALPI